ncbi:hypothetical protein BK702_09915 [Bacillus thuringiensis serovar cameroun]|nr:hypothetical protein BK702_09915 [Bacillus thuringiensis serovar cameroun]
MCLGEWCYLYRVIDCDGHILDFQLRKTRNHQAAYAFMKRLIKHFEDPSVLTPDKAPVLLCTFKKYRKTLIIPIPNCIIKHHNNLIEQNHRYVKHQFLKPAGF